MGMRWPALGVWVALSVMVGAATAETGGLGFYVVCAERPGQEGMELPWHRRAEPRGQTSQCVLPDTVFRVSGLEAVEAQEVLGLWNADANPPGREKEVRVMLVLRAEDAARFKRWTRQQIGRKVALVVDGEVIFAARILAAIEGGKVQLKMEDDLAAAERLAARIRAHVPVERPPAAHGSAGEGEAPRTP